MSHVEYELKFAVAEKDFASALRHAAGAFGAGRRFRASHELATYFDTPTFALKSAGLSLCVRAQGSKHIQTIKASTFASHNGRSPAASGSEWEWRLADREPDLARLEEEPMRTLLPTAALAELRPMFSIDVERTTFEVERAHSAAEVAFDRGYVRAGSREKRLDQVEVELKRGRDVSLIYAIGSALHDSGALHITADRKAAMGYRLLTGDRDEPVKMSPLILPGEISTHDAFRAIVRHCMSELLFNQAALMDAEPAGVHQFRVAVRRMRAALRLFRELIASRECENADRELGWLGREVGEARDWDVFVSKMFPLHLSEQGALDTAWQLDRLAHARAAAVMRSERYTRLFLDLGEWVEGNWHAEQSTERKQALAQPLKQIAGELLDKAAHRVRKAGKRLGHLTSAQRHRLRKQAKKLRYGVELFSGLYPEREAARYADRLKALQDTLGDINDLVVARGLFERIGADTRIGKSIHADHQKMLKELARPWQKFAHTAYFWET